MSTVHMLDTKTHLSKLVGDVESGAVDEVFRRLGDLGKTAFACA